MTLSLAALVTGAGGGIGRAVSLELARRGFAVVAADKDGDAAQATSTEIRNSGGLSIAVTSNVTSLEEVLRLRDGALEAFRRIDALVYASGILRRTPSVAVPIEEWHHVIDVNLTGAFLCAQAVHAPMRRQQGGRIVNITSVAAHSTSLLGGPHYTASKAGLLGLTRHLAREWAPDGITVNCVSPGFIDSPMTHEAVDSAERQVLVERIPLGRAGRPNDVAAAVAFLASPEAAYITGADISVHGGLSL
jgi:3-oxoacyl-[acyl-carrier protein] reductase